MSDDETPAGSMRRMAELHGENAAFWADAVFEKGVTEHTPMRLFSSFGVQTATDAYRIRDELHERGYIVRNETPIAEADFGVRAIKFAVPVRTWTPGEWNEWTDQMVRIEARTRSARFGGIEGIGVTAVQTALFPRMRHQREQNAALWGQLQKHGVSPETELALEAHFWTPTESSATALAAALCERFGYAATTDVVRRGFLGRQRTWSVTGTRPSQATNPADIDTWTDSMITVAHEHAVEFDGWGTMIPR